LVKFTILILIIILAGLSACAPEREVVIPTLIVLPTLTDTLRPTATNTPTATHTATAADTATFTPTDTATDTPTNTPTDTASPTPTDTSTATATDTATPSPTMTDTVTPTPTPTILIAPTLAVMDTGRLSDHAPILSSIDRAGELDRFFIRANVGDAITVVVRPSSGSGLRPRIEIYDPEGLVVYQANAINTRAQGAVIAAPVLISMEGSYGVYITGENDTTGVYTLSYGVGESAENVDKGELPPDNLASGTLTVAAMRDVWRIALQAGEAVTARLEPLNGAESLNTVMLVLVDPAGEVIASVTGGSLTVESDAVKVTGIYLLRVHDTAFGSPGAYGVRWGYR